MLKLEKRITLHTFDVWASPLQVGFASSTPGRALP